MIVLSIRGVGNPDILIQLTYTAVHNEDRLYDAFKSFYTKIDYECCGYSYVPIKPMCDRDATSRAIHILKGFLEPGETLHTLTDGLFSNDTRTRRWHQLCLRWHPDKHGQSQKAKEAFQAISELYNAIENGLSKGELVAIERNENHAASLNFTSFMNRAQERKARKEERIAAIRRRRGHRPHQPPIPKRPTAPIAHTQYAPSLPPQRANAATHQEQCIVVVPVVSTPKVTYSSVPSPNVVIPSAQAPCPVAPSQPNRTIDARTRTLSPREASIEAAIWKWLTTSLTMNADGPLRPTHTVVQNSKSTKAKTKRWLQSVHGKTLADCVQRYATDAETVLKMPRTPFTALEWFQHHLGYSRMRKKSGRPGIPWLRFVPE